MSPELSSVGIDDAGGQVCMTTWPGMVPPPVPAGTVLTYPGDGTSGLPPAERAEELPFVPGEAVGVPLGTVAGRELFVYEIGALAPLGGVLHGLGVWIGSASLRSSEGSVPIRWVDSSTPGMGSYLAGAIIIPLNPLVPDTRYTAEVELRATEDIPPVTHSWSFTTGAWNPSGRWPSGAPGEGLAPAPDGAAQIAPRVALTRAAGGSAAHRRALPGHGVLAARRRDRELPRLGCGHHPAHAAPTPPRRRHALLGARRRGLRGGSVRRRRRRLLALPPRSRGREPLPDPLAGEHRRRSGRHLRAAGGGAPGAGDEPARGRAACTAAPVKRS